jgi:hypothetical protein
MRKMPSDAGIEPSYLKRCDLFDFPQDYVAEMRNSNFLLAFNLRK